MEGKGRERSVANLQLIYTVLIGLAVAECLRGLLSTWASTGKAPTLATVMAAISFLVTIVPLYHGASAYLDATYVSGERSARSGALLLDLPAVFLEGLLTFALALMIHNTSVFFTLLALLFLLHTGWVGLTNLTAATDQDRVPDYRAWAAANVIAVACILVSLWSNLLKWSFWPSALIQSIAVGLVTIGRTVYDYSSVWGYYYPPASKPAFILPVPRPAPAPAAPRLRGADAGRRALAGERG